MAYMIFLLSISDRRSQPVRKKMITYFKVCIFKDREDVGTSRLILFLFKMCVSP